MKKEIKKGRGSLILSTVFVLLLIATLAFTIVGVTYADSDNTPDHVLNYETNRLYWSHASSDIEEDGTYRLNLFDSLPTGEDGMKIIAPGATDGGSLRLVNKTGHSIEYSATIFLISEDDVPITADFWNFAPENIETGHELPSEIADAKVLRSVSGVLSGFGTCEFRIRWEWAFEAGDEADEFDTYLGDLELSEIELGVWV